MNFRQTKFYLLFGIFILLTVFTACSKYAVQNTVLPENDNIKTYQGKGIVTKINFKLGSVELDHEEIKGSMPAMIMEFYVKEKSELEVLKIGDKVDFILEENRGQEKLISIKKIK